MRKKIYSQPSINLVNIKSLNGLCTGSDGLTNPPTDPNYNMPSPGRQLYL